MRRTLPLLTTRFCMTTLGATSQPAAAANRNVANHPRPIDKGIGTGEGCESVPTQQQSWGAIKSLFR
jgi:hypothetical protein